MSKLLPVLAFDTCGVAGSAALAHLDQDTGAVACVRQTELRPKSSAAQLMPAIAALLEEAGLNLPELYAIVVVHGPGSFTGVRVALSTAKGLAHASGVPVVAVSRLAVLAGLSPVPECLALLDGGRGEFYAGSYGAQGCQREWLASQDEVEAAARSGLHLVVAEDAVANRLCGWLPERVETLDACAAIRASAARLLARDWDDLAALDANYLRQSDAQLFARVPAQRT